MLTLATYIGLRRFLVGDLYASEGSEDAKAGPLIRRTKMALAFSLGLDLGIYPFGGGLLKTLGDLKGSERLRSYGRSMWLQGLVHLTNSAVWIYRLSGTQNRGEEGRTKS